jgi:hypothetical protein
MTLAPRTSHEAVVMTLIRYLSRRDIHYSKVASQKRSSEGLSREQASSAPGQHELRSPLMGVRRGLGV